MKCLMRVAALVGSFVALLTVFISISGPAPATTDCKGTKCVFVGYNEHEGANTLCHLTTYESGTGNYLGKAYSNTFAAADSYGTDSKGGFPAKGFAGNYYSVIGFTDCAAATVTPVSGFVDNYLDLVPTNFTFSTICMGGSK